MKRQRRHQPRAYAIAPVPATPHAAISPTQTNAVLPLVSEAVQAPGKPLDAQTRADAEAHFGRDFSQVRVHADDQAAMSAQAMDANAYAVGNNVVFDAHHYDPDSREGQRLLAHELTHVAQQAGTGNAPPLSIGDASSAAEKEAEQSAGRLATGQAAPVAQATPGGTVQRQPQGERRSADDDERRPEANAPAQSGLNLRAKRLGLNVPQLQLDPQIAAQIRAIQYMHGLLTLDNILGNLSQVPAAPARPQLLPTQLPAAPAGGLGMRRLPTPPAPLVPPGAGPATPRSASTGDLVQAILKIPVVSQGLDRLRNQAETELRTHWNMLSTGERVLVISHSIVLGSGVIAGIASSPEAREFVLEQLAGQNIDVPGLPLSFQLDLSGREQHLTFTLDVGKLLPSQFGFR